MRMKKELKINEETKCEETRKRKERKGKGRNDEKRRGIT